MNKKVILGMSGGVDSSTTAFLLKEAGYDVIGVTFQTKEQSVCSTPKSIRDAQEVADILKIKHSVVKVQEEFDAKVIVKFVNEYLNGRTPNPCIECNYFVRWNNLLKIADELNAYFVSTGHYAKIRYDETLKRYILYKAEYDEKDQSYVMWRLTQKELSRSIFPLGKYRKSQVREIASSCNLPVAKKRDSYEICFVPDNDYGKYLDKREPDIMGKIGEGDIIFQGEVIGKHKGYPYYTIGQRRGLGVALKTPVYVKNIIPEKNIVEIGEKQEIEGSIVYAVDLNIHKHDIEKGFTGTARIRHKDVGTEAVVEEYNSEFIKVRLKEPKNAITPGQSLVLYEGDDVVLGGIITKNNK
jgi:tRNA-specific 2-thiouridylase